MRARVESTFFLVLVRWIKYVHVYVYVVDYNYFCLSFAAPVSPTGFAVRSYLRFAESPTMFY